MSLYHRQTHIPTEFLSGIQHELSAPIVPLSVRIWPLGYRYSWLGCHETAESGALANGNQNTRKFYSSLQNKFLHCIGVIQAVCISVRCLRALCPPHRSPPCEAATYSFFTVPVITFVTSRWDKAYTVGLQKLAAQQIYCTRTRSSVT